MLTLTVGEEIERNKVLTKLVEMLYERNDLDFKRGTFRVRGDVLEIIPANQKTTGYRVEFFGDEIDRISEIDTLTGVVTTNLKNVSIFPASHFVVSDSKLQAAIVRIKKELVDRLKELKENNKLLAAERLEQRTNYDIEMLEETGFCSGVENYSAPMAGRSPGETPTTLMDFFPKDYLLVVDESHVTLPQVRGMYNGDRARKMNLVDYGFRLPSALDNRPLKYDEFEKKINQAIYVSATPGDLELEHTNKKYVEQIIRPTGLLDPTIEVRKTDGQIDDLVGEINDRIAKNERVLITTLTIRMAEELTNYLKELDIKVAYLHSEVKTLERMQIIHDVRAKKYDVLVLLQVMPELHSLNENFMYKQGVLIPMYDGIVNRECDIFFRYRFFKIICFSETLYRQLSKKGYKTYYIKYFPEPINNETYGDNKSIFLWQRSEMININTVATLMRDIDIDHIHIHKSPDPGQRFIEPLDEMAASISYSEWFDNSTEIYDIMKESAFYFAPRVYEGMAVPEVLLSGDHKKINEYRYQESVKRTKIRRPDLLNE